MSFLIEAVKTAHISAVHNYPKIIQEEIFI